MVWRIKAFLKKKTKGKARSIKGMTKRFFLKTGFVMLMLGLMTFAVYQCVQHMTVGLDTLRTQEITSQTYAELKLFTFRDEAVLPSGGEIISYHVSDGEKVGVGKKLATVYACPEGQDPAAVQVQLTSLARRLTAMQRPIGQDHPTGGDELTNAINADYTAFLQAAERGDLGGALALANRMEDALNAYDSLMYGGQTADALKTLEEIRNALLRTMTETGTVQTAKGGYFFYQIDGYEALFDVGQVMTVTPEEFLALTRTSAQTPDRAVAGKMVYTPTWYAAAYVDLATAEAFQDGIGGLYDMVTTDGTHTTLPMTLVRFEPTSDGALVVFKTQAMPDGFAFSRSFSVRTQTGGISGYRVPDEALVTLETKQGDVTGVYVLQGNIVEFRKIMPAADFDGYVIVKTYDRMQELLESLDQEQRESLTADGYAYLNLNDKIITRGTGLYEGKIVG